MLTPISGKREVRRFLVFDLEWIPHTLNLRMVGVFDGWRYRSYTTVDRFLATELTSQNRGKWFYAHFGGGADMLFVLEAIIRRGGSDYRVTASFAGSTAVIVKVTRGKNCWYFVDSYWLMRDSLRSIGQAVGLHKTGEDEKVYCEACKKLQEGIHCSECGEHHSSVFYADYAILRDYNERDCRVLWKAIDQFESVLLEAGGQLQMTIASCAMHLFRRRYLKQEIETSAYLNETARRSYTSSRVEVIRKQCLEANYYDINSSFPYAMTSPCPASLRGSQRHLPEKGIYLADIEVTVPSDCYLPPLPYRHENRVFFPVGSWRGWFMSTDVELLLESGGRIDRVHEALTFDEFTDLAEYAHDVYDKRKKAPTDFEKIVYKYLLNSLYGKFAESNEKQSMWIHPPQTHCWHFPRHEGDSCLEMLFPGVWLVTLEVPIAHAHVPISAHITAIARRNLYRYLRACERVYYCDTDSVITESELPTSDDLGGLKHEYTIKGGRFLAPKVYQLDREPTDKERAQGKTGLQSTVKAKGFSRMTVDKWLKLQNGELVGVERMMRFRELYRTGDPTPVEKVFLKKLQGKSQEKRKMLPNGDSRPWHVDELR